MTGCWAITKVEPLSRLTSLKAVAMTVYVPGLLYEWLVCVNRDVPDTTNTKDRLITHSIWTLMLYNMLRYWDHGNDHLVLWIYNTSTHYTWTNIKNIWYLAYYQQNKKIYTCCFRSTIIVQTYLYYYWPQTGHRRSPPDFVWQMDI